MNDHGRAIDLAQEIESKAIRLHSALIGLLSVACGDEDLIVRALHYYATPTPKFWHEGYPPKPFCDEWFIAKTTGGDCVVLTALPDEYSYDFKTADETYFKKERVKEWAQFPDSEYIPFNSIAISDEMV